MTHTREERSVWSEALLTTTCAAVRDRRALPDLETLLDGSLGGNRLRRQRRTIEQRHADGLDISAQRRRYRALVDTLDGLATICTLPCASCLM